MVQTYDLLKVHNFLGEKCLRINNILRLKIKRFKKCKPPLLYTLDDEEICCIFYHKLGTNEIKIL